MFGTSGVDYTSDRISMFLEIANSDGIGTAISAYSNDPNFSIMYMTSEQTKNLLETGKAPSEALWSISRSVHEMDYYGEGIRPHMAIYYDDNLFLITNSPRDSENYPQEVFEDR